MKITCLCRYDTSKYLLCYKSEYYIIITYKMIHQLACVHPDAIIADDVEIGPFVTIDADVTIGAGTKIYSNVTIFEGTRIGKNCTVFPGAVIGAVPQDLKFKGEKTTVEIGDNTAIRECATIHRGTAAKGRTVVGSNCLIMAYCHVAHDCILGDNIIMSNSTQLAGEVDIDDYAIIGGGTLVHQFTHIGPHSMIQGGSRINKDVPPYAIVGREPIEYCGINAVGLSRRGFSKEQINTIQDTYRLLYNNNMNNSDALAHIEASMPQTSERDMIINFVRSSARGIVK